MIETLRIENYKALRDVSVDLTPIHALIGPNDSGKTSILEALEALCRSADQPLSSCFTGSWSGRDLVWYGAPEPAVAFSASGDAGEDQWMYRLACRFGAGRQVVTADEGAEINGRPYHPDSTSSADTAVRQFTITVREPRGEFSRIARLLHDQLSGVQYYRWVPRQLSLPAAPDSQHRFRMEESGFGLARCLDDILGSDRDAFIRLEEQFRELFPQVRSIRLLSAPAYKTRPEDPPEQVPLLQRAEGKGIHIQYADGRLIPAAQASDGVLLVLAYLAILHGPEPPRVLLIEEPENGIHPKRLREVLGVLRSLVEKQQHTQVLLATHSPYVVDLFSPAEVTLCRMQDDGSVGVRRLSDSALVQQQGDVFTLGEIWTGEGDQVLSESDPAVPVTVK